MKKIFWLVLIVISFGLISCNSGSQQHHSESTNDKSIRKFRRITGKVVNAADMKPIGGLIISFNNPIKNKPVGALTDTEGKFVLDSIPGSVNKITVVNVSTNKSKEVELNEEDDILIKMD
jgi:hypothetical protein